MNPDYYRFNNDKHYENIHFRGFLPMSLIIHEMLFSSMSKISHENMVDLLVHMNKKLQIKFNEEEESVILRNLPKFEKPIKYYAIYRLQGKHSPCVHEAVPNISRCVKMKKSKNGKYVMFSCTTTKEAQNAALAINTKLKRFGYNAKSIKNIVIFETSTKTSLTPKLSKMKLRVLFCEHGKENEKIYFADKSDIKPKNLVKMLTQLEKELSKELERNVKFPKKIKMLSRDMWLPNVETYSPKFMSFIIEQRPTTTQLRTYIALYNLAELGIPFSYVDNWSLNRIIHQYTKIPKKTLEKQLSGPESLQKRLATIYSFAELDTTMNLDLVYAEVNDIAHSLDDHIDTSFKEAARSFSAKSVKHSKKIKTELDN